ncbi:ABC transporter ATP-binding protein [Actinokineospora globicatena]|uniref:Fatty acid ABC transporter ATP-binding/permease protein n=1 Tax=Actinokineospora globicatena TaxID=103729 RepID=A0A9W6QKH6_9PSEU|nr:ABC transporter ATP-binding protein [Actinokineospora globicatena]GLW91706.1 multidrug ABC transporter ATP-binding protein [Actinokineospora globicatena]
MSDFRATVVRLLGAMRPDRPRVIGVVAAGVAGLGLTITVPVLLGSATDAALRGDLVGMARLLAVAGALSAGSWGCLVVQGRLIATVAQRLAYRLRERASAKLSRVPVGYLDTQPRGDLLSRATNDIENVAQTVQHITFRVVASLINAVGALVVMLLISPLLSAVLLVTMPAAVLLTRVIGRRAQPGFDEQWAATGQLSGQVEQVYTGHEVVTAFGRHPEAGQDFAEHNERVRAASVRAEFTAGLIGPAVAFLGNINYLVVAVLGAVRVTAGALTIGDVQAFLHYVTQVNQPVTTFGFLAGRIQSAIASAARVFDLLDAEEQTPDPPRSPVRSTGAIEFRNVTFGYGEPLLRGLSITVQPGQMVAVVGPTGAGKSTLVNLLLRFYDPDSGTILLDGTNTRTMSRDDLRSAITVVPQDTWLFHGTIADNIGYGHPDADPAAIVTAARTVHADHLIRTLPAGYDTVIDDSSLSTGERQLITLARASLARSTVLVLDEATSSVDTRTEVLVQQAMTTLRRDRTTFVIAHRLSTIRSADLILVMEDGAVVEQGTHATLLAADGPYTRLYVAQFALSQLNGKPAEQPRPPR